MAPSLPSGGMLHGARLGWAQCTHSTCTEVTVPSDTCPPRCACCSPCPPFDPATWFGRRISRGAMGLAPAVSIRDDVQMGCGWHTQGGEAELFLFRRPGSSASGAHTAEALRASSHHSLFSFFLHIVSACRLPPSRVLTPDCGRAETGRRSGIFTVSSSVLVAGAGPAGVSHT
ncbi:hypothetical protein B0H11DRAFT_272541 [Mycena galericulata]|nr:hypothetical protein B0H11DRAFT_272541 [Mycena galericulata]